MKSIIIAYLSSAAAMLALDAVWLGTMGSRLYRPKLGHLLLPSFNLAPAILFYLIYVAGIVVLAVQPALAEGRIGMAAARGAMFGLCAYATYDLTNQATLKGWPTVITVADLCWGTFLTAVAATVGWWAVTVFAGRV